MPRGALFCITLLAIAACEVAPSSHRTPAASASADTASGSSAASAAPPANANPPAPPANPPAPPTNGSAAAAPPPSAPAPSAPAPSAPKESCVKAASHIADLQAASLTDPDQKQMLDQQRTQIVAQVAGGCTTEGWSDAVIACITNATEINALTPCSDMLRKERAAKAPPAPTPPPSP
jgi:hypothetical protein